MSGGAGPPVGPATVCMTSPPAEPAIEVVCGRLPSLDNGPVITATLAPLIEVAICTYACTVLEIIVAADVLNELGNELL